jgi:hypothetical protein
MPLKLAPVPHTKKQAAKEALIETVFSAKSILLELIQDLRASDRFFKHKAGILLAWVGLGLVAVVIACPSSELAPSNALSARARIQQVTALDRQITALYLENMGDEAWGNTALKLNNLYTAALPAGLKANGGKTVVALGKFRGPDGEAPPPDLKMERLEIRSDHGKATLDLTEGEP